MSDGSIFAVFVAALIGLGGLLIWATIQEDRACQSAGGHMLSKTEPGVGLGSNGQMVTTINTVSFCISKDGRILE